VLSDTGGRIDTMREVRATALINTPPCGLHMAEEAAKMGMGRKEIGTKRMLSASSSCESPSMTE
jgi:phenylacetate-coenzyme A ligase PaaK-like adenylate-forming protein